MCNQSLILTFDYVPECNFIVASFYDYINLLVKVIVEDSNGTNFHFFYFYFKFHLGVIFSRDWKEIFLMFMFEFFSITVPSVGTDCSWAELHSDSLVQFLPLILILFIQYSTILVVSMLRCFCTWTPKCQIVFYFFRTVACFTKQ